MLRVRLTAEHEVIEHGRRRIARPGEVIEVSDRHYRAFRDRMERVTLGAELGAVQVEEQAAASPEASESSAGPEPDPEEGAAGESAPADDDDVEVVEIRFASPAAKKLAIESGLEPESFLGVEASSPKGFTAADVKALLERRTAGE